MEEPTHRIVAEFEVLYGRRLTIETDLCIDATTPDSEILECVRRQEGLEIARLIAYDIRLLCNGLGEGELAIRRLLQQGAARTGTEIAAAVTDGLPAVRDDFLARLERLWQHPDVYVTPEYRPLATAINVLDQPTLDDLYQRARDTELYAAARFIHYHRRRLTP